MGSTHLVLAGLGTAGVVALTYLLWQRTRDPGFVIGAAALYYWSIYGAFVFLGDQLHHVELPRYEWVIASTFPIAVDDDYFSTIAYFCTFVISALLCALVLTKPRERFLPLEAPEPLSVSHPRIVFLGLASLVAAYILVRNDFAAAALQDMSIYTATRAGEANQTYSVRMIIHQVLIQIACGTIAIGAAVYLSGGSASVLTQNRRRSTTALIYMVSATITIGFCVLLGRKNELVFGVLLGLLIYFQNHPRPRFLLTGMLAIFAVLILGIIDAIRGLSIATLLTGNEITVGEILAQALAALSSNESVGSHFSLYGAVHWHTKPTYGTSILSLAASVIPRFVWMDRPGDIYAYYAQALDLPTDVGYSIHHATGWYINFGSLGVLLGGMALGVIWAALWNSRPKVTRAKPHSLRRCLSVVAFAGFTASMPMLLRAGIEAYKGVIMLGVVFPALLLWTVSLDHPLGERAI